MSTRAARTERERRRRAELSPEARTDLRHADAERQRTIYRWRRQQVLDHYGRQCACCGEDHEVFLVIDHIENDGSAHRQVIGKGAAALYRWLVRHGFPPGFQTLCFNCNFAKSNGGCPHARTQ